MAGKYVVSHSNYTIKKKNKVRGDSTIYERDFMATTNLGGMDSVTTPIENNNFKFTYRKDGNWRRKRKYGDFIRPENGEYWTDENLPTQSSTGVTSETVVEIRPDAHSLLDFAYFGNCTELIKSSIRHIISTFPGELYISNIEITSPKGDTFYVVENPFLLDLFTRSALSVKEEDKLKYFCVSRNKYVAYTPDLKLYSCIEKWSPEDKNYCIRKDWDLAGKVILFETEGRGACEIREYCLGGKKILVSPNANYCGFHIRPSEEEIEIFRNGLDDFEKVLLSMDSIPPYTAIFDYPHETERGIETYRKSFSWPYEHGWNLSIEGTRYQNYLDSLLEVAKINDEYYTNNLWRMLTHEAIVNMDVDFAAPLRGDDDADDIHEGTGRVEGFLWAVSRQFDDLKRYVEGIKNANVLNYDGNASMPDYTLSDSLELAGWEVSSAVGTLKTDISTPALFKGSSKKYFASDANVRFLQNLYLSSANIFSKKGTRSGIESILGLFGLTSYDFAKNCYDNLPDSNKIVDESGTTKQTWAQLTDGERKSLYDYSIKEYAVVAEAKSGLTETTEDGRLLLEYYNEGKISFPTSTPDGTILNSLMGIPARIVEVQYYSESGVTTTKYVIPWFSNEEKYDGGIYFQMFGGWGKMPNKEVSYNGQTKKIITDDNFTIYDETQKYLHVADKVEDLTKLSYGMLRDGDIFYVYDADTSSGKTNYYIINNKENYQVIGEHEGKVGWTCITEVDIDSMTTEGTKVLYLESLIDEVKGNNPHNGYGQYDGGKGYLRFYEQLLKYAIDNDAFRDDCDAYDCETGEIYDIIKNLGFNLTEQEDNVKCWYFVDSYSTEEVLPLVKENIQILDEESVEDYYIPYSYKEGEKEEIKVGKASDGMFFDTELEPVNPETASGSTSDEASANSIINVKKLKITFEGKEATEPEFKDYLYKVIMPYLKQMIPSTAIVEISTITDEVSFACLKTPKIIGFTDIDNNESSI